VSAVDSVKIYHSGNGAFFCVDCPEPKEVNGKMMFSCKKNTAKPCIFWTGLKFEKWYEISNVVEVKYKFSSIKQYEKNFNSRPRTPYPFLVTTSNATVKDTFLTKDDAILDDSSKDKALYKLNDKLRHFIFTDVNVFFDKSGELFMVQGLSNEDNKIPLQHFGLTRISLKWGEYIKFKGLDDKGNYNLDKPVLSVTSDALELKEKEERRMVIKYWWEGKDYYLGIDDYKDSQTKYQDREGKRPSKTLCSQTFINYAPGSQFMLDLSKSDKPCQVSEYKLSTALIEKDDVKNNKGFFYSCGKIRYWARGGEKQYDLSEGNIRKLYCNQSDSKKPKLYCRKGDGWCEQGNRVFFEVKDNKGKNYYLGIRRMVGSRSKLPIGTFKKMELGNGRELLIDGKALWLGNDRIELSKSIFKIIEGDGAVKIDVGEDAIIKRFKLGNSYIHRLKGDSYVIELGISKSDNRGYISAFYPKTYQNKLKKDKKYIVFSTRYENLAGVDFIPSFGTKTDKNRAAVSIKSTNPDVTYMPKDKVKKEVKLKTDMKYSDCHYFNVNKDESLKRLLAKECFSQDFTKLSPNKNYDILNKINFLAYSIAKFNPKYFSKQNVPRYYKELIKGDKGRDYQIEKQGKLCYRKTQTSLKIDGQFELQLSPGLCPNLDIKKVTKKKAVKVCPRGHYEYRVQSGDNLPKIAYRCGQIPVPSIKSKTNKVKFEKFLEVLNPTNKELITNYKNWKDKYDQYGWVKTKAQGTPYYLSTYDYSAPPKGSTNLVCLPDKIYCLYNKDWKSKRSKVRSKVANKGRKQNRDISPLMFLELTALTPKPPLVVNSKVLIPCRFNKNDCSDGEKCVFNYCMPPCRQNSGCAVGRLCNTLLKSCFPKCMEDPDCQKLTDMTHPYCGSDGLCKKERPVEDQPVPVPAKSITVSGTVLWLCQDTKDCKSEEDCLYGVCRTSCQSDRDCISTDRLICDRQMLHCMPKCFTHKDCISMTQGRFPYCYKDSTCWDKPGSSLPIKTPALQPPYTTIGTLKDCKKNEECPPGQVCSIADTCVLKCIKNEECKELFPDTPICNRKTGQCIQKSP